MFFGIHSKREVPLWKKTIPVANTGPFLWSILNQRESWYVWGSIFQNLFGGGFKSKGLNVKQENTTFPSSFKSFAKLDPFLPSLKRRRKKVTVGFVLQKSIPLIFLEIKRPQRLFLFFGLPSQPVFHLYLYWCYKWANVLQTLLFVCLHREKFCQNLSKWKLSQYCKDEFSMVGVSGRTPERSISSKRGMTYG